MAMDPNESDLEAKKREIVECCKAIFEAPEEIRVALILAWKEDIIGEVVSLLSATSELQALAFLHSSVRVVSHFATSRGENTDQPEVAHTRVVNGRKKSH